MHARRWSHPVVLLPLALVAIACSSSSTSTSTNDGGASDSAAGGDGGSQGEASSASDSSTPADPQACTDYCDLVNKNCTGTLAQYEDLDCESVCKESSAWSAGAPGATSGNTLGCRVTYAQAAASDQAANCAAAGKGGGGKCGTLCESFCRLSAKNCVGGNRIYTDDAACMSTCGTWDTEKTNCEIYHLNAAGFDATTHCPHGAADSHACG
jgi:hypothetical protein